MPGGDGRGPAGDGPMTGRGSGYCAGNNRPGYAISGGWVGRGMRFGRGVGRFGRGIGRGFRWAANQIPFYRGRVPVQQGKEVLEEEKKSLLDHLSWIEEKLKSLKDQTDK